MGVPKHLALVDGEPVLGRTVRLLGEVAPGSEVIITSHDERYEFEGAVRHEPENNVYEIDRFFYGNSKSVVAVRIGDADLFRKHFDRVRGLYLDGKIEKCKGWQIYQSVTGQDLSEKPVIGDKFVVVDEQTTDINTPEEYRNI